MKLTVEPSGSIVAIPGDSHKGSALLKGETCMAPGNMASAIAEDIDKSVRH